MLTFLTQGALNPAAAADWAVKMPFVEDLSDDGSAEGLVHRDVHGA